LREGSPRIPEALGRGSFVAVSARVGNDLSGYVCDIDVSGLLLDVRDPSGDPGGYEFLPWSSIERVRIRIESGTRAPTPDGEDLRDRGVPDAEK
jgi:hypothetical protein